MKTLWLFKPDDSEVDDYRISNHLGKLKNHVREEYKGCTFSEGGVNLVWVHDSDGDEIGFIAKVEVI